MTNFYEVLSALGDVDINVEGKVEKDGTFSAKVTLGRKGSKIKKEIDLIDISREEKSSEDLSDKMLKSAFGSDFDTTVGTPKVVR
ncbi:MAG: hypothetical protein Q4A25_00265 [Candidatus Saccharibacteria bacterium]|nr:hypothetical protein [Candidatus Saccharibacteria bacterium]